LLTTPAQISKIETTSDGGLKLTIHTQELLPTHKAEVMELHNKIGWFLFSETNIEASDIPDEPIEFEGQKTLSERLRNALYVLHEKQGGKSEDYEAFRNKYMERLLTSIKNKISEID